MTDAPRPHHIEIEVAVEQAIASLLDDPDGRDVEVERDDLLAIIYAWRQEQAAAGRCGEVHEFNPVVTVTCTLPDNDDHQWHRCSFLPMPYEWNSDGARVPPAPAAPDADLAVKVRELADELDQGQFIGHNLAIRLRALVGDQ